MFTGMQFYPGDVAGKLLCGTNSWIGRMTIVFWRELNIWPVGASRHHIFPSSIVITTIGSHQHG